MSTVNRVFVVDDDEAVRDSLTMLLEASGHVVQAFPDAKSFLDYCSSSTLGCIILDVDMPDMDGPTLQEELIGRDLRLPIIFLSGKASIPVTVRTIKAGAMDFLTKPVDGLVLLEHIHKALKQCSILQKHTEDLHHASSRLETLTSREHEVMVLIVEGLTSKEIAQRLAISYRTVEIHRAHVMQKTSSSNLMDLAHLAEFLKVL